jgi:hydrogenase expression/formation protein HypC
MQRSSDRELNAISSGGLLMCLGVPGKVTEIYRERDLLMGKVDFGGVLKSVCLETVPSIAVGEYALVHVGFALARIDEQEAGRVFELLEEMKQLEELRSEPA